MIHILKELNYRNAAATLTALHGKPHPNIVRLMSKRKMYEDMLNQLIRSIHRVSEKNGDKNFRDGSWRATRGHLRLLVPKAYMRSWLGCMISVEVSCNRIFFHIYKCDDPSFTSFAMQLQRDVQARFPTMEIVNRLGRQTITAK